MSSFTIPGQLPRIPSHLMNKEHDKKSEISTGTKHEEVVVAQMSSPACYPFCLKRGELLYMFEQIFEIAFHFSSCIFLSNLHRALFFHTCLNKFPPCTSQDTANSLVKMTVYVHIHLLSYLSGWSQASRAGLQMVLFDFSEGLQVPSPTHSEALIQLGVG